MKLKYALAILCILYCSISQAQVLAPTSDPDWTQWTVTAQDECSTTRECSSAIASPDSASNGVRRRRVVAVASGLNYLDAGGVWRESEEAIDLMPDGRAAGVHGQYKVYFNPDLTSDAAITLVTRSNRVFQTHPIGIYYFDTQSSKTVLLAEANDSAASEIQPPNQIIYKNAFKSDFLVGDLRLTYTRVGFESDVILTARPKVSPGDCGLDPKTTQLQVKHAWLNAPMPVRTVRVVAPGLVDETLDFGELMFPIGNAFAWDGDSKTVTNCAASINLFTKDQTQVPVGKQWKNIGNAAILTESVCWNDIAQNLATLPAMARVENSQKTTELAALNQAGHVAAHSLSATAKTISMASGRYAPRGVVLDYITVSGGSTYTFYSGLTYWFPAGAVFSSVTFQPGAVLKYAPNAYLAVCGGSVTCSASGTAPVVLTSQDDNQFGDAFGSGNPSQSGQRPLMVYSIGNATLQNLLVRWGAIGPYFLYATGATLRDSRVQQCGTGVQAESSSSVTLVNDTMCSVTTPTATLSGSTITGTLSVDCGPLYSGANFPGLNWVQSSASVPDTMGAVGSNDFIEILNDAFYVPGGVAVYDKNTGNLKSPVTLVRDFFTVTVPSGQYAGTYPQDQGYAIDQRILYDQGSGRWFALVDCGIYAGPQQFILAVSKSSDPVGSGGPTWVSDHWRKYYIPLGTAIPDFDRLGVDGNGVYISAFSYSSGIRFIALPKAPLLDGSAPVVQSQFVLDDSPIAGATFFQAVNFDPITINDPCWFVAADANYIYYNKLQWVNGLQSSPQFQWMTVQSIPISNPVGGPLNAHELGGVSIANVAIVGANFHNAVMRKVNGSQYIWACHHVGLNSTGSTPADRTGVEWFKLQTGTTLTITETGRIYDQTPSNPKFFYYPSISANSSGDILIGFSGSGVNDYISAYFWGKLNNGAALPNPVPYFAGKDYYPGSDTPFFRWGDYSYTSPDPDGVRIWTVQEYAETRSIFNPDTFGTRILSVMPLHY